MALSVVTSLAGSNNNGNPATLSVATLRAAGAVDGDLLVVFGGTYNRSAGVALASTNGSGSFSEIVNALSTNFRFRVAYKTLSSDDTTITCAGSGNIADALSIIGVVVRGFDAVVLDQVASPVTGTGTNPDCPAVITQTDNAMVLAIAGSMNNDGTPGNISSPYSYGTTVVSNRSETNPATVAFGSRIIPSPITENPGVFPTWSTGTWVAVSVAIRAATVAPPVVLIGSNSGGIPLAVPYGKVKHFYSQTRTVQNPPIEGVATSPSVYMRDEASHVVRESHFIETMIEY